MGFLCGVAGIVDELAPAWQYVTKSVILVLAVLIEGLLQEASLDQ
jgi:hypothetical protein